MKNVSFILWENINRHFGQPKHRANPNKTNIWVWLQAVQFVSICYTAVGS